MRHVMKAFNLVAVAALLLTAACDDDQPSPTPVVDAAAPDGGTSPPPPGADAGVPGTTDTGGGIDTAPAAVPLIDWVHDLVVDFGPMSDPDTVDDKNIRDTDDPAAFDSLLQQ